MAHDDDRRGDALAFVRANLVRLGAALGPRFAGFAEFVRRYGRDDARAATELALAPIVDDVVALVRPELERRARVVVTHATAPAVRATERQLAHLLVNLLVNAGQAIGAGDVAAQRIDVRTGDDGLGHATLDVEDSGAGIPRALHDRIMEPHFSTKGTTGLGLTIVRQIVAELGGTLVLESRPGAGTRFRVLLPAAAVRAERS